MCSTLKIGITDARTLETVGLEVGSDTSLEVLKSLIEVDLNVLAGNQLLFHHGRLISEPVSMSIGEVGIRNNSIVMVYSVAGVAESVADGRLQMDEKQRIQVEAERLLSLCEEDEYAASSIRVKNERMGEALKSKDLKRVVEVLSEQWAHRKQEEELHVRRMSQVAADPLSEESQRILEDEMNKRIVEEQFTYAQEHMPESFGNVVMLYIDIEVNGKPMTAFVDSGAQSTIMSKAFAEKCNLVRLIDVRFRGIARGVGTSTILGRIHTAQIKIGSTFLAASITVLEDDKMDFLLGLDMMRRHQMVIDLKSNHLHVGSESVPFLGESEIKENNKSPKAQSLTFLPAAESSKAFAEDTITRLMELGFKREACVGALELTGGDSEKAASWLMSDGGRF